MPTKKKRKATLYNGLTFDQLCKMHGIPLPDSEYQFHTTRKWRLDHTWGQADVALEVEGGVWTGGRHTRGKGFIGDIEKYNEAQLLGWSVFRCTPQQIKDGSAFILIKRALGLYNEMS